MSTSGFYGDELERLVDSHIELSELFGGATAIGRRNAPCLVAVDIGKTRAEVLADLVDRAVVAYEGYGFSKDPTILALKLALAQEIVRLT
jgi:hypothetical protein